MKKFLKYSWMLVLPAVVAAAVIWKSSAAVGQCPEVDRLDHTVLLPNPADCSSFFSCSLGVPILMHCPDGLHFNDKLDVCDWPQDAGCEEVEDELEEIEVDDSLTGNLFDRTVLCKESISTNGGETWHEGEAKEKTAKFCDMSNNTDCEPYFPCYF